MADNALEAGFDLDHWRELIEDQASATANSEDDGTDYDSGAYSDSQMRRAIRASREAYYGKRLGKRSAGRVTILPTPSLSPRASEMRPRNRFHTISTERSTTRSPFRPSHALSTSSGPSQPSRRRADFRAPSSKLDKRPHLLRFNTFVDVTDDTIATPSTDQRSAKSTSFQHTSFFDKTLCNLDRGFIAPKCDTIHGEL
jgi:hypothetical protein